MTRIPLLVSVSLLALMLLVACAPGPPPMVDSAATMGEQVEAATPAISMRESGIQVTVHDLGDVTVHSLTAPEQVFASSTHIIETPNSLVLIDTQFILPMALDYRAYADSLGKPIERLIITHAHPDHFLGSEAFADVDIYALAEVSDNIAAIGQAEVDEKQAEFGDAIASTFVVPAILEPGTIEIDGIDFTFEVVRDAEAEIQAVIRVPAYNVVAVGDIVYSGSHLILAGPPPTWTAALNDLKAESTETTIVLPGHGLPAGAEVYDQNIAWLAKAVELLGTATSGEEFKAGMVGAFPDLGMEGAIDFVLPFLFPAAEEGAAPGLIEVITVEPADGASAEDFLAANQVIKDEYASQQPGYLARETAVSESGLWRLSIHWESREDSDASIAGFGDAPGLDAFMSNLNPETMVIKQYELLSTSTDQVTFPDAGVTEVITVRLQDGADVDGFLAANQAIEEGHIAQQPGFIARETGVSEDGEWMIVVHWETAEDSAASIASFGEAPGVEEFMSFLDAETMEITVFAIANSVAALEQSSGDYPQTMGYTQQPPVVDPAKGYFVAEIADGTYWLSGSFYQTLFFTTGEGVIAIDAPQPLGQAYLEAIREVTDEPITHVIYSHAHSDHIGAAGIFPSGVEVIAHQDVVGSLDGVPAPTITFEDTYTLEVGNQLLELSYIGPFHSEGDIIVYAPRQQVALAIDLFHPGSAPFSGFGITIDLDAYTQAHDILIEEFNFNVLIPGHTEILATKAHVETNKALVLSMKEIVQEAIASGPSDEVVQTCIEQTIEQWNGLLENLEDRSPANCQKMADHLLSQ